MPRTRQYQAPSAPNNQAYGQRGDQVSQQRAMPIPQAPVPSVPSGPSVPGPAGPTGPGPAGAPQAPDVLGAAQAFDPGPPLMRPTERPGEPVTTGLPIGAGAGPEAMSGMFAQRRNRVADMLEIVADTSNDAWLRDLARQARQMAG